MSNDTAITKPAENPAAKLSRLLNGKLKDLEKYARNSVDPATMIRLAVSQFAVDENLAKCRPETFYTALITAAQLGLEPSGVRGEAYLVPFKGTVQLIPGWRGLIKLALRSKAVRSIYSHVVRDGDDFAIFLGTDVKIHHRPQIGGGDDREVIGSYAVAVMADGTHDVEWMDAADLKRISDFASRTKVSPAYEQWGDQMARKAPIRRLCKRLPLGDDYFLAAKLDELHEAGKPEQIAAYIDIPSDVVDVPAEGKPDRIAAAVGKAGQ